MVEIRYSKVRAAALILLAIPSVIFFLGWLKPVVFLPCALLLNAAVALALKTEERVIKVKLSTLVALGVLILLWAVLSGQGGFFTQKQDYEYRNAIFRDLINYNWPVRYGGENDESLVYYIGYWLFPSLVGKAVKAIGGFAAGWLAARIAILVQTVVMVYVSFLLVLFKLGRGRKKAVFIAFAIFVLFSGMDAIPVLAVVPQKFLTHIEWWAGHFQYSSMSTQLCWVFNQAVPAWLACAVTFNEKNERSFALIGLLLLSTSPLPLVGLAVYMLAFALRNFISACKEKKLGEFFKNIFTAQNIIALVTLLPVYALYYGNNAVTTDEAGAGSGSALAGDSVYILIYFMFVFFEFGALLFMLRSREKRFESIVTALSLLIIPLIRVGGAADFCMRASIPALFMLMLMLMEYLVPELLKNKDNKEKSKDFQTQRNKLVAVLVIVAIGAATPAVEYTSSVRKFIQTKGECVTEFDYMESLADKPLESKMNFVGTQSDESAFYKYIADK